MEKLPNTQEISDAQKETGNRIADELEKILSEESLVESVPRVVHKIVQLLRLGDIKSAKKSYGWESEKFLNQRYKRLRDFLRSAF